MTTSTFRAQRISKTATITLKAPLDKVFHLFDPIGEKEWAAGWDPQMLYPGSDLVEEHMVFKTPSHGHHESEYIWTVSKYLSEQGLIEYMVHTPERVWWITIQCRADSPGESTTAEITYTYTGLTEIGNALNERALRAMYAHDLKDWEKAINTYLETGKRLEHH